MIVATCPLRISLVGGSTDHPHFLEKYNTGAVISFPSCLKTYITLHKDVLGITQTQKKYIVNYSKREECSHVDDIQNDLVREVFKFFNVQYSTCALTSDIFSSGSGLASSSSYIIALIKAVVTMHNINISDIEICNIANQLEKKFNPLVGQQDFYGSGIGGLKKITFYKDKLPSFTYLKTSIFDNMDMILLFTEKNRLSTNILQTINIDKSREHLADVNVLEQYILENNVENFCKTIRKSWETKKNTSPHICANDLIDLDRKLYLDTNVLAHKLCGAGGGGFFLVFTKKGTVPGMVSTNLYTKIGLSTTGVTATRLYD